LKTYLPENYNIFGPCFPLDPIEALALAEEIMQTTGIDIVVASSLGAFTALQLRGVPKIVINPCLFPSKELPKHTNISEDILQNFAKMEKQFEEWLIKINSQDIEESVNIERMWTYGVFSTDDELFSFKDKFEKYFGRGESIKDTHRISVENVEKVIVPIIQTISETAYRVWNKELQDEYKTYKGVSYNGYSVEDLRKLASDPNSDIRKSVAAHRRTPTDILEKLANDEDKGVRGSVAMNKKTSISILEKLANDEDKAVRIYVAWNENIPISVLEKMSENAALGVADNKNTPIHILEKLSNDTDKWVLVSVTLNPSTPDNIVEKLLCDTIIFLKNEFEDNDDAMDAFFGGCDGIENIVMTRKFSNEMFEWLINYDLGDWSLSDCVAENENTPTYILEKLLENKDNSDLTWSLEDEDNSDLIWPF
ncbi:MAG: hypothetical protein PHR79_09220, partial [Bacteroidales bacterium]|nr:hypothetical protein [Bacteroidales bacterium]